MPCRDDWGEEDTAQTSRDFENLRKELDQRTDMLCQACRLAEARRTLSDLPVEVQVWWRKHKEFDKSEGR